MEKTKIDFNKIILQFIHQSNITNTTNTSTTTLSEQCKIRSKILKIIQTQFKPRALEENLWELFNELKWCRSRHNDDDDDEDMDSRYPFQLVTPIELPLRKIHVNANALALYKLIMYFRMMHGLAGVMDACNPNIALELQRLPFARLCCDIDISNVGRSVESIDLEIIRPIVSVAASLTSSGDILITRNCTTPNTPSFHLITEQQFDICTMYTLLERLAQKVETLNLLCSTKIDLVYTWMLPFGRGHVPVSKFVRESDSYLKLTYPFSERDFELCMCLDLTQGTDNLSTLLMYVGNDDDDDVQHDAKYTVCRIIEESISYYRPEARGFRPLASIIDLKDKLQTQVTCRRPAVFNSGFIAHVLCHEANVLFLKHTLASSASAATSNANSLEYDADTSYSVQSPPIEFYEIYRFLSVKFTDDLSSYFENFKFAKRNVIIGNLTQDVDTTTTTTTPSPPVTINNNNYDEDTFDVCNEDVELNFSNIDLAGEAARGASRPAVQTVQKSQSLPLIRGHGEPWPYLEKPFFNISPDASTKIRWTWTYFNETIRDNVYPYEEDGVILKYLAAIRVPSNDTEEILLRYNRVCGSMLQKNDFFIPLYEFFCKVHHIPSAVSADEFKLLPKTLSTIASNETQLKEFKKYIEMSPCEYAYRKFPGNVSRRIANLFPWLTPINRVILHVIYLLIVEYNFTAILVHLFSNIDGRDMALQDIISVMLELNYDTTRKAYINKEFVHFIHKCFLDTGHDVCVKTENRRLIIKGNHINSMMKSLQNMFVAMPVNFFLCSFQYMNEEMIYEKRFKIFLQIFQRIKRQPAIATAATAQPKTPSTSLAASMAMAAAPEPPILGGKRPSNANSGGGGAFKKSRSNFNPEPMLKKYNVEAIGGVLIEAFFNTIAVAAQLDTNGMYVYSESRFKETDRILEDQEVEIQQIEEPAVYVLYYRRNYGVYNTWTMHFERHTPALFTLLDVRHVMYYPHPYIFNAYDDRMYKIVVNRYLKSLCFTDLLNDQKNLVFMLAPLYDPNTKAKQQRETLLLEIDSVQVHIHDFGTNTFRLPKPLLKFLLSDNCVESYPTLCYALKWVYLILCHFSEQYTINFFNICSFVPKSMQLMYDEEDGDVLVQADEFMLPRTGAMGAGNERNETERLVTHLKQIITMGEHDDGSVNSEPESGIVEMDEKLLELQKLSRQEIYSLLMLYDDAISEHSSMTNINTPMTSLFNEQSEFTKRTKKLSKRTLHMVNNNRSAVDFEDELLKMSKNTHLYNLFDAEISDTMRTYMRSALNDGDFIGLATAQFLLVCLSWFVRVLHLHEFKDTLFFRYIHDNRQQLYNEIANIMYTYNGHFLINTQLADVQEAFSEYVRKTELQVDEKFTKYFPIPHLYLNYNPEYESQISSEIINHIEQACISAIYQGQFIKDTNVDLMRLWARVTFPPNKHRISPCFTLKTGTGMFCILLFLLVLIVFIFFR